MITYASKLNQLLLPLMAMILFVSCSNDESDGSGTLKLSAKASVNNDSSMEGASSRSLNTDVFISDFLVNIGEFELELDESEYEFESEFESESGELEIEIEWEADGYFDYEDEIELEGPFELDLLAGTFSFISTEVPNGTFDELEFEFERSENASSDLFGKSILIQGTINDIPFIFWHDFEEEVEVDFEETEIDIVIRDNTENITIDFDLSGLFDVVSGINLSQAQDGNEDGTIEISPQDPDGNNALANEIKEYIKEIIELIED